MLKWIHFFTWTNFVSTELHVSRLFIAQTQCFLVLFNLTICLNSKKSHATFRRQKSRHSMFVNTRFLESLKAASWGNLPACWRFRKISWKDPKTLWQESHNKGIFKTNEMTKTVKMATKYSFDILESSLALVPLYHKVNKSRPVDNLQFYTSFLSL